MVVVVEIFSVVTLSVILTVCLLSWSYLVWPVFWESGRVKPHKSYLICPQLGLPGGTVVFNTQPGPAVDWDHLLYLPADPTGLLSQVYSQSVKIWTPQIVDHRSDYRSD